MDLILALGLIGGGLLAAAPLLVGKSPEAKKIVDALIPFSALIGAGLLALGAYYLVTNIGFLTGDALKMPILGATLWGMIISGIGLGIMFGMPMVARLSPAGAQKGAQLAAKLAPFQVLIGLLGIGSGAAALLLRFHIISVN